MPRKREKLSPLIRAMAEWAVDDTLAAHDAGLPQGRKRLPRSHYRSELTKRTPDRAKPKRKTKAR